MATPCCRLLPFDSCKTDAQYKEPRAMKKPSVLVFSVANGCQAQAAVSKQTLFHELQQISTEENAAGVLVTYVGNIEIRV